MTGGYSDALHGYAFEAHSRDGFRLRRLRHCRKQVADLAVPLVESSSPRGNPSRDDERYIVTACRICKEFCNRTLFDVKDKAPQEIVGLKRSLMGIIGWSHLMAIHLTMAVVARSVGPGQEKA